MDKSYRIHTNISNDTVLNVNMHQDFDFLEVLSLKLRQKDAYRLHSSNYGVIIGRVLANDAFGIPNAKVSVFIERDENDPSDMEAIYPYSEVTTKDSQGRRYNLLPDYSDDDCYKVVGTFPNKRLLLDDDTYLEVYDKYWKYTTVTNQAGDYMIFAVPTGSVQVHVDIDLSDIGILSQKPRDFEYKGYNLSMFDTPNQFKDSTNLDGLAQIFSQNKGVFVYPFWGDSDNGIAAITRSDIQIQYKFEPTCVFMGSIVSDNEGHSIGHKCAPDVDNGMNNQLVGGNGTIEMIRKTVDGLVEEYPIQGNQLIDDNGVWCYQIPMNLDYIGTDEYGNIVPTDNPNKGIPTRTQVRFRFSKNETNEEGFSRHTAKYLVPMNPMFSEEQVIPTIDYKGSEVEKMYNFGSATPDSCFRDLYWNNVYSVKNYIPKTQVAHRAYAKNYSALKGANLADDQTPVPFNKLRVDIPFTFMIICILFKIVMIILSFINTLVCLIDSIINIFYRIKIFSFKVFKWRVRPFGWLPVPDFIGCIPLSAGLTEGNTAYYPGCWCKSTGLKYADCPEDFEGDCKKVNDNSELTDKIQQNLALDFKIIKLDFYQDWLNGCLYMPLWYWRKRKKKTFLFGLFSSRAKNDYCSCNSLYSRLKTYVTCSIHYTTNSFKATDGSMPDSENRWHKSRRDQIRYKRGLIKPVENRDGLTAYYYVAVQAVNDSTNKNPDLEMEMINSNFHAVRLYATDIILLGNLDPNNIYGIPQFFTCLPTTTANIPAIATIEESINPNEKENDNEKDVTSSAEDTGTTVTTGMDWGHDGNKKTPKYSTGLFMDLACTYASTRAKSCINVERLSEFGVNLDMSYTMAYHRNGEDVEYGIIDTDGFINKYELDDTENRAMFATLNHVGFIPQSYQDSIPNGYTTQVLDENTNYLIPKFKYLYPVDFDGRLQAPMTAYKNGFEQPLYDEADESYITFRMGAEKEEKEEHEENIDGRIRHFYKNESSTDYAMPLYNNSYYFYFGIKKGSTAIDKFNKMFYAACFKQDKKPFNIDIDKRGRSYCPSLYENTDGYGYIKITLDDIRAPYTYRLYDSFNDLIIEESGMTVSEFIIGGNVIEDKIVPNPEVRHQIPVEMLDPEKKYYHDETNNMYYEIVDFPYGFNDENKTSGLTNQEYIIEVIDNNGKVLSEKIKLDVSRIKGEYESIKLGTKFYNTATTRIDYICNDDNKFYGIIRLNHIIVDGYKCDIEDVGNIKYAGGKYTMKITASCEEFTSNVVVRLTLNVLKQDGSEVTTNKCLCDQNNGVGQNENMFIADTISNYYVAYVRDNKCIEFYVYQPNRFLVTLTEYCTENGIEKLIEENSSTEIINVQNGENFTAMLNGMPINFMIGTFNDSNTAKIADTTNFYSSTTVTTVTENNISGWFGVHQEDSYQFNLATNLTCDANQEVWEDVINTINDSVSKADTKRTILRFKFESMFSLSEGTYITTDSNGTFTMRAKGGVSPLLYRNVAPYYEDSKKIGSTYVLSDSWQTTCPDKAPNIVGNNYSGITATPSFNYTVYATPQFIGNYFGVFTNNGSYINNTTIDGININVMRIPSFASISPMNSNIPKKMGKDETGTIETTFLLARTSGSQTLDNDKARNTLPYLRAMYIDRRFDFDLTVLAPVVNNTISLYKDDERDRNRVWKGGRISGFTYNGIEMSYDKDYNVISANTPVSTGTSATGISYTACTPNKKLEYSYYYEDGDCKNAITIYNDGYDDCVWGEGNVVKYNGKIFGYDERKDANDNQIVKAFYESTINDIDIRHVYWSKFNKNRLYIYASGNTAPEQEGGIGINGITNVNNPYYVYAYPNGMADLYNDDFNITNRTNSYPTRRFIDIGNLPIKPTYEYTMQGCSYGMNVANNDDGTLTAEARGGESMNITLEFGSAITFIPPNAESSEYANAKYEVQRGCESGYRRFVIDSLDFNFKYNEYTAENFDVYTKVPRFIKVLPYMVTGLDSIDGIGYIKTANPGSEFSGVWGDGKTLDGAIGDVTFAEVSATTYSPWLTIFGIDTVYMQLPEDITTGDTYSTKNGEGVGGKFFKDRDSGDYITSDDTRFTEIQFIAHLKHSIRNANVKAFSILVDREYQYQDDDYLTRHLRSIETTDIYDCRDLLLTVCSSGDSISSGEPLSYVEMRISSADNPNVDVPVPDVEVTEEGEVIVTPSSESVAVPDTTKLFSQTITFDMKFDTNSGTSIENRQCEVFADYQMMSYTFRFENRSGDKFDVSPSSVVGTLTSDNWLHVRFTVKWTQTMDIMGDESWIKGGHNYVECTLFARTRTNFIYKLGSFQIFYKGQNGEGIGPTGNIEDIKKSMLQDKKYITEVVICDNT